MKSAALLIEIGTEEIPAAALPDAAAQFAAALVAALEGERLKVRKGPVWYTPRRIVVRLDQVPTRQDDLVETVIGPPCKAAYDGKGAPTRAALAFVQKHGADVSRLKTVQTPKGEYVALERTVKGTATAKILQRLVPEALSRVQFAKTMYWTPEKYRFPRPIRWLLALFQDRAVAVAIAGVSSSRYTSGHRFLGKRRVKVHSIAAFREALRENGVIIDPQERRAMIERGLAQAAAAAGGSVLEDADLLEAVVNLNEYPSVILGDFESRFLRLPQEILITVMRQHQKYFAVTGPEGCLLPHFLAVINLPDDPQGMIRAGHGRVLKARLADAEFFWNIDVRIPLKDREDGLRNVVYHEKLGSYYDKTQRVVSLLPKIAAVTGGTDELAALQTAGRLMKCDLVTEMVKEFTDLQGVVGGLYARAEGYPEIIWRAVSEQYQPSSSAAPSPCTRAGAILSLADRLDTVCGCFSIGLIPSGSKDPFAVRRQGNGIIKIILDHKISLSIGQLATWGLESVGCERVEAEAELGVFLEGRLRFILEEMGFSYDTINAAFAVGCDDPFDVRARVQALQQVRAEPDFLALASSFKRISNILIQAAAPDGEPDPARMNDPAEIELWRQASNLRARVEAARVNRDYGSALRALASLRTAVDRFFDRVLVMDEDPLVRSNRLAILKRVADMFLGVADISLITIEPTN